MKRLGLAVAVLLAGLVAGIGSAVAGPLQDCASQLPFGVPKFVGRAGADTTPLCRTAYLLSHDNKKLVALWVTYRLSAEHAMGCLPRKDDFAPDPNLPKKKRAELVDYEHLHDPGKLPHYDRGHMAPNADFDWSVAAQRESFYLSNMSPQVSELNQQQWENLEEHVRTWASLRGEVVVFVGPIFERGSGTTVGPDHVAVPLAYYKIIVDAAKGEAIAFDMNNVATGKGDLSPFITTIASIEADTGIEFALPAAIDHKAKASLWDGDPDVFEAEKKKVCSKDVPVS